jgi:hypothetical protein
MGVVTGCQRVPVRIKMELSVFIPVCRRCQIEVVVKRVSAGEHRAWREAARSGAPVRRALWKMKQVTLTLPFE